ncbi:MAG TPA: inosine/xanthosine triphosphatase [Candidatus Paceibacterota bacterium]
MRRVIVGSHNPVKVAAVQEAFAHTFPDEAFDFVPCAAVSLVPDQPFGSEETKLGAKNRADDCVRHEAGDFYVGLEGGVEEIENELWAMAWMCVRDKEEMYGFGKTSAFLLPPKVVELIRNGKELGHATDQVFETLNSKHEGGTIGILTNGIITRKDFYRDALIFALIPFIHVELYRT